MFPEDRTIDFQCNCFLTIISWIAVKVLADTHYVAYTHQTVNYLHHASTGLDLFLPTLILCDIDLTRC